MTGRGCVVLSIAACIFAFTAIFSGLDRYSEHDAGAVRLVPDSFRVDAWRVAARQAFADGDIGGAEKFARRAVSSDPLDPRGLSLLGMAHLAKGKGGDAAATLAAADKLGLRSPIVQAYFFDKALADGDAGEAAVRLDTLLLSNPRLERQSYFFSALEHSEAGRKELASRVLSQPQWGQAYLAAFGEDDEVLRARAAFIARNADDLPLGCDRIEPMLRELAQRSYRADAARLASAQCPSRAVAEALADPGFEKFGDSSVFGWRRHSSGDVRISAVGTTDTAVEIANRSAITRLVLSQPVALEEGEYRAFASVLEGSKDAVLASLDCGRPKRPSGRGGALGRGQLVAAMQCDDLVLGIWIKPRSGKVRLDNLRLTPVGQSLSEPSSTEL